MKIMLTNVRLAFPNLFKPTTVNGEGDPAYSATFIFPPDHVAVGDLQRAIDLVGQDKWGAKWPAVKKELQAKDKTALHDGDTKSQYGGFEGNFFVSSRAKQSARPTVIDRNKSPLSESDGRPYAGCYVNASVELWAQDNAYGKRINAQLRGVQFLRDGDSFGGGSPASSDEFDEVAETADDLT